MLKTIKDPDGNFTDTFIRLQTLEYAKATYDALIPAITYTVTWKDYDNTVLEEVTGLSAGATPSYDGTLPTYYLDDHDRLYVFTGWSTSISEVTANVVYTAQYDQKSPYVFVKNNTVCLPFRDNAQDLL